MKFLLAALIGLMAFEAHAAKVLHLQGRAFLQNAVASTPLARGLELPTETHLVLEKDSRTLIQISDDTTFEIHGPARASLSDGLFWNLEEGRFLIFTRGLSLHRFRILGEMIRPDTMALEIEVPQSREYAQIILMWGSASFMGEDLKSSRIYVVEKGRVHSGEILPADALKRRQAYDFSQSRFKQEDDSAVVYTARNQLVLAQVTSLNENSQVTDPENTASSTSVGLRAELIHKRYLDFPRRPQRIHFLRSPSLRLGAGLSYLSSTLATFGAQQALQTHGLVGVSWRGLALDGVLTYLRPPVGVIGISPFQYGARALYEWDLKDFTANDMMIGLGYGYTVSKTTVAPIFKTVSQSLDLSLIFNF